jgi:hypothetical protein
MIWLNFRCQFLGYWDQPVDTPIGECPKKLEPADHVSVLPWLLPRFDACLLAGCETTIGISIVAMSVW